VLSPFSILSPRWEVIPWGRNSLFTPPLFCTVESVHLFTTWRSRLATLRAVFYRRQGANWARRQH
jgi:hypothetical protein